MIYIDGSEGEGGGQMIRTALALSALTGLSFEATNIRAGRSKPGLKAQHLTAINALKQICNAQTNDIDLGSEKLRFIPNKIKGGKYEIDIGTAGSISLLLQALLVPCLFAPKKTTLTIKGGTCGLYQAPVEYTHHVLLPYLQRFGKLDLRILKRGYYPKGGGEVEVSIAPATASTPVPITFNKDSQLLKINGIAHASTDLAEAQVAERAAKAAKTILRKGNIPIIIQTEYQRTLSPGAGITLWATFSKPGANDLLNPIYVGADGLGEKGVRAESLGESTARALLNTINQGPVADPYLVDQLIPFMGLLPGSKIIAQEITGHTTSNIAIVERFLPVKFNIDGSTITTVKTE